MGAFLPIVGARTSLMFGLVVGLGVSAGRSDVPRLPAITTRIENPAVFRRGCHESGLVEIPVNQLSFA